MSEPVQMRAQPEGDAHQQWCSDKMVQLMAEPIPGRVVQRDGGDGGSPGHVHAAAERGISSASTSMPHASTIQASFGKHDISHVQAHVGGGAADACNDMGASAFASGDHVAFAKSPDLHTAAHEAAHVVQQARGVNLYGGVGQAGDSYERHADQVADAVVGGKSAEGLLSAGPFGAEPAGGWGESVRSIAAPTVQRKGGAEGEGAEAPAVDPANAKVAKLHLYADIEAKSMGIAELQNGSVGHTWIALEYLDTAAIPDSVPGNHKALLQNGGKYADPMGFWPDIANGIGYSPNPLNSYVQGWMRHPDDAHQGAEKASQTWLLTQAEVDSVIRYAESKRGAKYSVFFFNCTHFGVGAVKAAGKSAPSATMAGIAMPNALYDGIKARQQKGEGDTMTKDFDGANEVVTHGAEQNKKN
ncbi:MAG: DUF4157 domain-containing protein [Myxococcales bacterium]|nr:DUF4157 domain-containing protein [Myxococcales bacterium]